jgi:phage terminase large subunit-like protein
MSIILAVAALLLVFWLYTVLFPSDESVIKKRMQTIARLASFGPGEGDLTRLANVSQLAGFFTQDISMRFEGTRPELQNLSGRDTLRQMLLMARANLQRMSVRFPDIVVAVDPDRRTAKVDLTVVADVNADKEVILQELKLDLTRADGSWRISRVETLKALDR